MSEGQVTKTSQKTEVNTLQGVVCSNSGNRIAPVFKRVYDNDLKRNVVKKVDETDIQEFINASRSMTDLAALEKRLIATGEIPAVDPSLNGDGIDFTQYPKDIHEVYSMVNDIDSSFSKLPENIQKIFGTKEVYMASALKGTLKETIINGLNKQTVPADTPIEQKGE